MRDNPKILKKYKTPNQDGQIAENCVHFNNSFIRKNYKKDTCSVLTTLNEIILTDCVILDGEYCDCFRGCE